MKFPKIAFVAFAGLFSVAAHAVTIPSGEAITTADCPLLGEQVILNLSSNVNGAYACDEANSLISVAACHRAGSRNPLTVTCAITSAAGVTPVTWNDPSCADATDTFEIADYRGYSANSQGGRVAPSALGGQCTEGTINGLVD